MYVRLPVFSSLSFHSLSYQWKGGKTRLVFVSSFKNVSIAAGETEKLVRFPVLLSKEQQAAALACLESTVLCIGFYYGIPVGTELPVQCLTIERRNSEPPIPAVLDWDKGTTAARLRFARFDEANWVTKVLYAEAMCVWLIRAMEERETRGLVLPNCSF